MVKSGGKVSATSTAAAMPIFTESRPVSDLASLFEPRSVAVFGASRDRHKLGSEVLHNIVTSGFSGPVIPVHPSATEIQALQAFKHLADYPGDIDLAIIVVPAPQVEQVVDDCLAKHVKAICILSAGFGECSEEGRRAEEAIVAKARAAGCRVIGPNCMGVLTTDPAVALNATFSPVFPPPGNVAMSTQSGALGLAILDYAKTLDIGISSFASVGNKADVSGNDLLEYWEGDPRTSVILLYLESFGNPAKFSRIARRISRNKPIVALKSGRSTVGARAAASHTGALATSDAFVDALFQQSGVIRTDTVSELFDVASLLSRQPVPRGRNVAILTNAGGPGILAADACQGNGLNVVALAEDTQRALRAFLPTAASVGNPVDMLAAAPPAHYAEALRVLMRDPAVNAVIVIFIPPLVTRAEDVAAAIAGVVRQGPHKTVAGVFMRSGAAPETLAKIPCFAFPEPAAIALSRVAAYGQWRRGVPGTVPQLTDVDRSMARAVMTTAIERGGGWLTPIEANALIASVGITTPRSHLAATVDDAVEYAVRLGFPVAVKAVGRELLHKTEHKAVRLNLQSRQEVRLAATELTRALGDKMEGLLVQQQISGGAEMMLGAINDKAFGHVIVCGTGGLLIELLADSQCRLYPVTDQDADEMVAGLKGIRLLQGFRGAAVADVAAFREAILRLSALVGICPEIQELDVNPLAVLPTGVSALDVRVRVSSAAPAPSTRPTRATSLTPGMPRS
jgi:acetyl coenzyme A synthetase (ADP forming)-like protein